ncbi:TauD/TfdA family dioxygenase [Bradyrhizobium sp. Arg62]|uniref:TauD/TfdA dioxygenase family protein n=1 Tax=Bradyrhizobium brasilense TaxID=1419277 RepID=UPI001E5BB155|nr:TauD/TfdA family dioxygenase [Bradyrhizobium brasilense]MCC8948226.1 TauD/TfdA family dioxygenase [Bradyrhizobium brasilense]
MSNTMTVDNVIPRADIISQGARLGAEIKNIKLSDDLTEGVVAAISRLLLEHKVIFFRDQGHLDDAQQQRFAIRLCSVRQHPALADTERSLTIRETLSDRGYRRVDQMNVDAGFGATGPKISVLRGAVVPLYGGDIAWSSTAAAYLDLPESLRMLADNLWALHCSTYDYGATGRATSADMPHFDDVFTGTIYEAAHPVVRVHPATGERMLVLGHSVRHFVGLQKNTSDKLFVLLQSYLTAPENTVCWSWKSGDVAIWDNRATEHRALDQIGGQDRTLGPVAGDDDVPLGIVGRRSVAQIKRPKPQAAKAA